VHGVISLSEMGSILLVPAGSGCILLLRAKAVPGPSRAANIT